MLDDDEPPAWTLEEHLRYGEAALQEIASEDEYSAVPQPVCHHFWARSENDEQFEHTISGQRFGFLNGEFEQLGLTFESDRLEAWESVKPDTRWLYSKVPALFTIAQVNGFGGYHGWTWEPRNRQSIGACEFQVINHRGEG